MQSHRVCGCLQRRYSPPAAASAQTHPFYQGKQLSIIINLSEGGPTDTEARLVARHLGQHIPGNPGIVPRIMTGAGGMVAANWLAQVAPNDGLNLGFFTSVAAASVMAVPSAQGRHHQARLCRDRLGRQRRPMPQGHGRRVGQPRSAHEQAGAVGSAVSPSIATRTSACVCSSTCSGCLTNMSPAIQARQTSASPYSFGEDPDDVGIHAVLPRRRGTVACEGRRGDADVVRQCERSEESASARGEGIGVTSFYDYFIRVKGKPPEGFIWDAFDTMNTVARGYERSWSIKFSPCRAGNAAR